MLQPASATLLMPEQAPPMLQLWVPLAQLQVAPPQHLKDLAAALLQGLRLSHLAPLQSSSWQRGLRAELLPQHPGGQQPAGTAALPAA